MAKRYSTSTVTPDGAIVPWLASDGPLAYSPERLPESNYFFQYGWLMPRVYGDRRHYYFGYPSSLSRSEMGFGIRPFVDLYAKARSGAVTPIYVANGARQTDGFTTPIACYRYRTGWDNRNTYVLIQHGSYLVIGVAEQPLIKEGLLVLFRGLGKKRRFCWRAPDGRLPPKQSDSAISMFTRKRFPIRRFRFKLHMFGFAAAKRDF